jgi:hypothetical protein
VRKVVERDPAWSWLLVGNSSYLNGDVGITCGDSELRETNHRGQKINSYKKWVLQAAALANNFARPFSFRKLILEMVVKLQIFLNGPQQLIKLN